MSYQTEEVKCGVKIHTIETNKFKTNLIAVTITTPLERETITREYFATSSPKKRNSYIKHTREN